MFDSKTILSFIGARAGSKGLKNKNILDLSGKPLIAWTIEASLGSKYVDRTLVSTDGKQIAQVARDYGVDVPFLRPAQLATDESLLDEAMQHGIQWLKKEEGRFYDYILLLQPTSPLRTAQHIDAAIQYYFRNKKSSKDILISIISAPTKVGWLMYKKDPSYIDFCFDKKKRKSRRQELPDYYFPNGAIYFGPTEILMHLSRNISRILPFMMDEEVSIDIDSPEDLKRAEHVLNNLKQMGVSV